MYRCPMKLIFSMFGRAVGDAGAREQRVHRAAALVDRGVDRRLVAEVDVDRLRARQRDLGEVHHHDLGARVLHELRDRRAHSGGTTDDERPACRRSERRRTPSCRFS